MGDRDRCEYTKCPDYKLCCEMVEQGLKDMCAMELQIHCREEVKVESQGGRDAD